VTRVIQLLGALVLVAACGGNQATTPPTAPPSIAAQATNPVQAAMTALNNGHDSWQFTETTYEAGTPNISRTISGIQNARPSTALSFTVTQSGKPDLRYVRIGNDVWFDTGTGAYSASKASDNYVNLQFQQFYLDGIIGAAEVQGYEYLPIGPDTVGGVEATHYRLADSQIQAVAGNAAATPPADWAADVWIADADGALLRVAWGPQSTATAQAQPGFNYAITSLDCACPVRPPTPGRS
jgi:hypothetical protein